MGLHVVLCRLFRNRSLNKPDSKPFFGKRHGKAHFMSEPRAGEQSPPRSLCSPFQPAFAQVGARYHTTVKKIPKMKTDVILRSVFFSFFKLRAGISRGKEMPACPRRVARAMLANPRSQIPRCRGPEERRPRQAAALWELCFGAGMLGARVFSAFLPLCNALVR